MGHLQLNLLSLADVNVATPDKKSVMMYVMCYFQVLPHADIVMEGEGDPLLSTSPATADDTKSSTTTTAAVAVPTAKSTVPSQVSVFLCVFEYKGEGWTPFFPIVLLLMNQVFGDVNKTVVDLPPHSHKCHLKLGPPGMPPSTATPCAHMELLDSRIFCTALLRVENNGSDWIR